MTHATGVLHTEGKKLLKSTQIAYLQMKSLDVDGG